MKYNNALSNYKWKILLNPKTKNIIKLNWFVKNKNKFGNILFILKIVIIITLVFFILYVFVKELLHFYHNTSTIFIIFALLCALTFALYILKQYPSYYDIFYIRKELSLSTILLCATILSIGLSNILLLIDIKFRIIAKHYITLYGNLIFIYLVTIYAQQCNIGTNSKKTNRNTIISIINGITTASKNDNSNIVMHWKDIIDTIHGYESFMDFLGKEVIY